MPKVDKFFPELLISIKSMQYLPSTNSLLYSGTEKGIEELTKLIDKLDTKIPQSEITTDFDSIAMADERSSYPLPQLPSSSSFPYYKQKPSKNQFQIYKLQYHPGEEIRTAIQQMAIGLNSADELSPNLMGAIGSMQWIEATNSLLYLGKEEDLSELTQLIQALDKPKKQVFIEVLVVETDLENSLDFGLQWGSQGNYRDKFGYGIGNFPASSNGNQAPFAKALQEISSKRTPAGADVPIGRGFNLGTIGDIILHGGKSYFSLSSLVSALQEDNNSTIILNEKVVAQDNKTSEIFVGENIPFFASTTEFNTASSGRGREFTSNVEYRDVGLKLNITPLIGEGDIITLQIEQNITSVIAEPSTSVGTSGIKTAKTNMDTQVHVPDRSFVSISGMMRNEKRQGKSGIPCLGGLPVIGAAFSRTAKKDKKRAVMIFAYPQIIHSDQTHQTITAKQQHKLKTHSTDPTAIQAAINWLTEEKKKYDIDSTLTEGADSPSKNGSPPTSSPQNLPSEAPS